VSPLRHGQAAAHRERLAGDEAGVVRRQEGHGRGDVLVNNAGWDDLKPFLDSDEDLWDRVIDINYKGVLRTTHAVLPEMVGRGWGRVINIGSDAGRVGSSLESVYSGAKGGTIAFTKTVAREVARKGVTANVVCPGPTDTPFLRQVVNGHDDADKVIASMVSGVPMKRQLDVSKLRKELAKAVEGEDYERAAKLRDQIKQAEG